MNSGQGSWFGILNIPFSILSNASKEVLATVGFASIIVAAITSQKIHSLSRENGKLSSLPVSPLAALVAEGKSALNFQKSNGSPERENPVKDKALQDKARNFFNFKPPVRTVPAPEILKSANAAAYQPHQPSEPNTSENSTDNQNAPISSSSTIGNVSTEPGDDVVSRMNLNTTGSRPANYRRHAAIISGGDDDSDVESVESDSTVFSYVSSNDGVKFVNESESDSDSSDTDSQESEYNARGGPFVGRRLHKNVSKSIQPWKPQFLLSVTKWEYTDAGETVYTCQAAYTPSSSWTVRRTYAQFCTWHSSLGGTEGELRIIKNPWPQAEFVLFYMPVEAIENRIVLLHSYMSEVSRTEEVMRSDRVFRSLLQFLDPDPMDERLHDERHAQAIGLNGEDLEM